MSEIKVGDEVLYSDLSPSFRVLAIRDRHAWVESVEFPGNGGVILNVDSLEKVAPKWELGKYKGAVTDKEYEAIKILDDGQRAVLLCRQGGGWLTRVVDLSDVSQCYIRVTDG